MTSKTTPTTLTFLHLGHVSSLTCPVNCCSHERNLKIASIYTFIYFYRYIYCTYIVLGIHQYFTYRYTLKYIWPNIFLIFYRKCIFQHEFVYYYGYC